MSLCVLNVVRGMMFIMKYLSEEKYRKTKRKLLRISIFVLLLGFSIGIGVILIGVRNKIKLEEYYSEENRIKVSEQVDIERTNLEKRKEELENKGIEYDESTDYLSGEEYELYCIKKVLTLDFDWCSQDEYKNNGITHKYCKLKNELYKIGDTFNKKIEDNLYIYIVVVVDLLFLQLYLFLG